jgi:hypothetical protein
MYFFERLVSRDKAEDWSLRGLDWFVSDCKTVQRPIGKESSPRGPSHLSVVFDVTRVFAISIMAPISLHLPFPSIFSTRVYFSLN